MNVEFSSTQLQERLSLMGQKKNQTKELVYKGVEDWSVEEQEQFTALIQEAQTRIYGK